MYHWNELKIVYSKECTYFGLDTVVSCSFIILLL